MTQLCFNVRKLIVIYSVAINTHGANPIINPVLHNFRERNIEKEIGDKNQNFARSKFLYFSKHVLNNNFSYLPEKIRVI